MPESRNPMHTEENDMTLERKLREQLRASEPELDTRTRARLTAARRAALEQERGDRTGSWSFSIGRPAWGTLAVVAMVATVATMVNAPQQPELDNSESTVATGNGSETLAGNVTETNDEPMPELIFENDVQLELYENLELLEFYEDMEFYEWLADTEFEEMAS